MIRPRFSERISRQNKRIAAFALILAVVLTLKWLSGMFAAPQIMLRVLETTIFITIVFFVASIIARLTTKPIQNLIRGFDVPAVQLKMSLELLVTESGKAP